MSAIARIIAEERTRRAAIWQRAIAAEQDAAKAAQLRARAQADDDIWAAIADTPRIGFRHCDCDAAWRSICATLAQAVAGFDAGKVTRGRVKDLTALRLWFWTWAPKDDAREARAA